MEGGTVYAQDQGAVQIVVGDVAENFPAYSQMQDRVGLSSYPETIGC